MQDQMSDSIFDDRIELVVIICAYGRDDLTHQTLSDLGQSRICHLVCVVDNQGSFVAPMFDTVQVIRPSSNLGWTRGSNLGLRSMISRTDANVFVLLNNDVRLSPGFVDGLSNSRVETLYLDRAGLLWTGTQGGVNVYDSRQARFAYYQKSTVMSLDSSMGL